MITAIASLKSDSAYSQSGPFKTDLMDKESPADGEIRRWREKCTTDAEGRIVIPAPAFKQALDAAAVRVGMKIKGKGQRTYSKVFASGITILDGLTLPVTADKVDSIRIYANADGVRGSGKRVHRLFPIIPEWEGRVTFYILDPTITRQVFLYHLEQAGKFIGIGRFRPEKGGFNGRFAVTGMVWLTDED